MTIPKVISRSRRIRDAGSTCLRCCASPSTVTRQIEVERARSQHEENKRWAQEPGARNVLAQPAFDGIAVDTPSMLDSLENYLKVRRWHHPEGPPRRFLSHLLTFPLTLATGLREAGLGFPPCSQASSRAEPDQQRLSTKLAGGYSVKVACIGARAESSLPTALWRETLFALPLVRLLDLHHIGPEVSHPSGLAPPTDRDARLPMPGDPLTSVDLDGRTVNITWTRAVLGREACVCSDVGDASGRGEGSVAAAERAVAKSDAIVFFNPGFGHPHLREGWEGALKRLLCTGKPLIVTCHSPKDLDRDARQVHAVAERSCVDWVSGRGSQMFPRENVFRSLITAEDPLSRSHDTPEFVSSNWGIFVVPHRTEFSQRL